MERVRKGELAPVEQLARILHDSIKRLQDEGNSSFIIDGFPRDADQISYIQDKVSIFHAFQIHSNTRKDWLAMSSTSHGLP